MKELNITKLVKGCLDADQNSRKVFFEQFSPGMLGVCYRYSRSREDALDILQESFYKAFKNLKQLQNPESLPFWLKKIVVNEAIGFYKKENKFSATEIQFENLPLLSDSFDLFSKLELDDIMQIIQLLPDKMRMVLNMYAIDGFSHEEIAKEMKISIGTSKSNLSDARRKVKQEFAKLSAEIK